MRAKLFLASNDQPLDQAPFLRVIDSGDAAAQQASSIVLALLVVVSGAEWRWVEWRSVERGGEGERALAVLLRVLDCRAWRVCFVLARYTSCSLVVKAGCETEVAHQLHMVSVLDYCWC